MLKDFRMQESLAAEKYLVSRKIFSLVTLDPLRDVSDDDATLSFVLEPARLRLGPMGFDLRYNVARDEAGLNLDGKVINTGRQLGGLQRNTGS